MCGLEMMLYAEETLPGHRNPERMIPHESIPARQSIGTSPQVISPPPFKKLSVARDMAQMPGHAPKTRRHSDGEIRLWILRGA